MEEARGIVRGNPHGRNSTSIRLASFLWLTLQVALVLGVALVYRVELERGFGVVAGLLLVGFAIHAWLAPLEPEAGR